MSCQIKTNGIYSMVTGAYWKEQAVKTGFLHSQKAELHFFFITGHTYDVKESC